MRDVAPPNDFIEDLSAIPEGFRDARGVEDGIEIIADVCVVGSGAAGTALALRLRQRGRAVVLLESGGSDADPLTSSMTDLDTPQLPIGVESRQRFLGGTTNSWWGGAALLEEIDFAPRPWLGVPSWPLSRLELLPYYVEGCRTIGVPDLTSTSPSRFGGRRGAVTHTDDLDTVMLYWPRHPRRFRELLAPAVRERRGIEAYLFANVTHVSLGPSGRAVDHLIVRTINGRQLRIRPKTVVLACGGIENARLLLSSGIQRGAARVVGSYFMDHPKGIVGEVRIDPGVRRPIHPAYWDSRPGRFRLGVRLSESRQRRDGLLNGYVRFHPILASDGQGAAALREIRRRRFKALADPALLRRLASGFDEIAALALFRTLTIGRIRAIEIHNFLEQAPRADNRVVLSDRTDMFGQPLARLEWTIGDVDRRSIQTLHAALDLALRRSGAGMVVSPLLSEDLDSWPISRDASHHMGTTRMGDDPSTSVVDRHCRVHGVSNLYVAGSSVFPTSGYANPTLTIVALALRLGDHLGAD